MRAMIADHRSSIRPTLPLSLFDDLKGCSGSVAASRPSSRQQHWRARRGSQQSRRQVVPYVYLRKLNEPICACEIAGPKMAKGNIGIDKNHAALPPP
jgi:hypothetical protein